MQTILLSNDSSLGVSKVWIKYKDVNFGLVIFLCVPTDTMYRKSGHAQIDIPMNDRCF